MHLSKIHFIKQYYTAICVNLLSLNHGTCTGWCSPIIPVYQSDSSPLSFGKINDTEVSWIVSCFGIGGIIGSIVFGWAVDKFGRKKSIYLPALLYGVCWILTIFAPNVYFLYIGRLLGGIASGGVFITIPIYVTEISDKNIRGSLGTFMILFANVGLIIGYIIGAYFHHLVLPYLCLVILILFSVGFYFIPESPDFLLSKNNIFEMEKSIKYFNPIKYQETVFTIIESKENPCTAQPNVNEKYNLNDFCSREAVKGFVIAIVLISTTQTSGIFAILNYASSLFQEAGSSFHPNVSSIIVGILLLVGSYSSTILADNAGRKILLSLSSIFCGVFMIILGIYLYLKAIGIDVYPFSWVSLVSLTGSVFSASCGLLPLPYTVASELFPQKTRGVVASICLIWTWFIGFLLLKFYNDLVYGLGAYGCIWLFAACCIFQAGFIILYMPETKGRTTEEIMEILKQK